MLHTKNRKHRGSSKKSIIQGSESSKYNKYQKYYEIKNISSISFQPVSIDKVEDIIKTLSAFVIRRISTNDRPRKETLRLGWQHYWLMMEANNPPLHLQSN